MRHNSLWAALLILTAAGCASSREYVEHIDTAEDSAKMVSVVNPEEMQVRILAAHNVWRKEVRVPPLQWSEALTTYAQAWASTLQGRGCRMEHRTEDDYGENLAWSSGNSFTPEQVVEIWGKEKSFYDYDTNTCADGAVCGHYTQVVWRTTQAVGCAMARCGESEVWVCNYDPPGNWVGEKPY